MSSRATATRSESNSIFSNGTLGHRAGRLGQRRHRAADRDRGPPRFGTRRRPRSTGRTPAQPNSAYLIQFFSTPGATRRAASRARRTSARRRSGRTPAARSSAWTLGMLVDRCLDRRGHGRLGHRHRDLLLSTPAGSGLTAGDTSGFSSRPSGDQPLPRHEHGRRTPSRPGRSARRSRYSNANPSPSLVNAQRHRVPDPGSGPADDRAATALPAITAPVIIDGYSQPGSQGNDSSQVLAPDTDDDQETDIATITVQIDGSADQRPDVDRPGRRRRRTARSTA